VRTRRAANQESPEGVSVGTGSASVMLAAAPFLVAMANDALLRQNPSDRTGTSPPQEGIVRFTRLWVSSDGETHLRDCTVPNMTQTPLPGGKSPQYIRDLNGTLTPTDIILTQQQRR
jgi:hypothetical protein